MFTVRISESGGMPLPGDGLYTRQMNSRQYELKDHLGSVRAVLTDMKLSVVTAVVPGAYEPKVTSLSNYYPFGMDQPGRLWNAEGKYRYGFNGKEKDVVESGVVRIMIMGLGYIIRVLLSSCQSIH